MTKQRVMAWKHPSERHHNLIEIDSEHVRAEQQNGIAAQRSALLSANCRQPEAEWMERVRERGGDRQTGTGGSASRRERVREC